MRQIVVAAFIALTCAGAALNFAGSAAAQAPAENTGPNKTIVRTVTGAVTFRTISDQRVRGGEKFTVLVYPDGSRQITIIKDFSAVNAQQTIVQRVDKRFRPLETFAAYWTPAGYKGSIFVAVDGPTLRAVASGPNGMTDETLDVPDHIAVVHHGEIANGWYMWPDDGAARDEQTSTSYILNAAPRGGAQVSGFLRDSKFTRLEADRVTTPAGTFDTTHYKLDTLDIWISGEDRLLVRQTDTANDREYVLTEINTVHNR